VRSRYLRKSREGNSIRELYKGTMLGASWFSPDLQLARLDFEAGDFDAGGARSWITSRAGAARGSGT
jgi:hypothetical protein